MTRYKGAASIKGTDLVVTNSRPPSNTEEAARRESQDIKKRLRSMGIPYTQTKILVEEN